MLAATVLAAAADQLRSPGRSEGRQAKRNSFPLRSLHEGNYRKVPPMHRRVFSPPINLSRKYYHRPIKKHVFWLIPDPMKSPSRLTITGSCASSCSSHCGLELPAAHRCSKRWLAAMFLFGIPPSSQDALLILLKVLPESIPLTINSHWDSAYF